MGEVHLQAHKGLCLICSRLNKFFNLSKSSASVWHLWKSLREHASSSDYNAEVTVGADHLKSSKTARQIR